MAIRLGSADATLYKGDVQQDVYLGSRIVSESGGGTPPDPTGIDTLWTSAPAGWVSLSGSLEFSGAGAYGAGGYYAMPLDADPYTDSTFMAAIDVQEWSTSIYVLVGAILLADYNTANLTEVSFNTNGDATAVSFNTNASPGTNLLLTLEAWPTEVGVTVFAATQTASGARAAYEFRPDGTTRTITDNLGKSTPNEVDYLIFGLNEVPDTSPVFKTFHTLDAALTADQIRSKAIAMGWVG